MINRTSQPTPNFGDHHPGQQKRSGQEQGRYGYGMGAGQAIQPLDYAGLGPFPNGRGGNDCGCRSFGDSCGNGRSNLLRSGVRRILDLTLLHNIC